MNISTVFIGTGEIGASLLERLADDRRFDIRIVVTQPDRPAGRKMELMPSPIKSKATELGLPIFQPENINEPEALRTITNVNPDVIILMAYGQILKQEALDIPASGCINVHGSLLPNYRGASPIQQCLLDGSDETGISIMKMVRKMDAGPVYTSFPLRIDPEDNALILTERLANLTAEYVPEAICDIINRTLKHEEQDEAQASYCEKIKKSDGEINWHEDAKTISNKIRAYAGWPGSFTFFKGKRLKIINAKPDAYKAEPGKVFEKDHYIFIGTGNGSIIPDHVQMEGKRAQRTDEFVKGYPEVLNSNLLLHSKYNI